MEGGDDFQRWMGGNSKVERKVLTARMETEAAL
jgi:hypothetical protein